MTTKTRKQPGGVRQYSSLQEWQDDDLPEDEKDGLSPGGAAQALGVSRQCIYNWVERGILQRVEVYGQTSSSMLAKWLETKAQERARKKREEFYPSDMIAAFITEASLRRVRRILDDVRDEAGIDDTTPLNGRKLYKLLEERLAQPEFNLPD